MGLARFYNGRTMANEGPTKISRTRFEVVPAVGVPPVHFGMSGDAVADAMGVPRRDRGSDEAKLHYFGSAFQIGLEAGRANFIELSWSPAEFEVWYKETSVFDTRADALVARISEDCPAVERENGHTVVFYNLDLALWRPLLPSDSGPDAPENEYRNGRYWMTIAIGSKGYFRAADVVVAQKMTEFRRSLGLP